MMVIEEDKIQFKYNELFVLAAFLKVPYVYGVVPNCISKSNVKLIDYYRTYNRENVLSVANLLEKQSIITVELGGKIKMNHTVFQIIECMGFPQRVGRVWSSKCHFYLYGLGSYLVCFVPDEYEFGTAYIIRSIENWRLFYKPDKDLFDVDVSLYEKKENTYVRKKEFIVQASDIERKRHLLEELYYFFCSEKENENI